MVNWHGDLDDLYEPRCPGAKGQYKPSVGPYIIPETVFVRYKCFFHRLCHPEWKYPLQDIGTLPQAKLGDFV